MFGESLGTGVAVALAATQRIGGLVLEAPFTSAADIGARAYWFLPVRLLMKDPFHSDARIGKVTAPLLVLHGVRDSVVPIALGERLFSLANEPKRFLRFADGAHNDLDRYGALDAVRSFLAPDPALRRHRCAGAASARPLSLRCCAALKAARLGIVGLDAGMSVRADWEFVEATRSLLRRWVTPITASATLLALTTVFLWMIDASLQHDHLIFIYFVPTALIAIRYGSISAMCVTIAQHFRRRLFLLRAALQFQGGRARSTCWNSFCSACWRCSQAKWFPVLPETARSRSGDRSVRRRWPRDGRRWRRCGIGAVADQAADQNVW